MRAVGGVIGGYLAMFFVVACLATVSWYVLGPNGSFEPGSWMTTMNWTMSKLVVDTIAAFVGGFICYRIGGRPASLVLAAIIVVLGVAFAVVKLGAPMPTVPRPDAVTMMDAMTNARESALAMYGSTFLAAGAVLIMMMRGERKVQVAQ